MTEPGRDDEDADDDGRADGEADGTLPARVRSAAEWTTFAVSLVVVAALVGLALVEQFIRREPAGVRVTVAVAIERAEERDGRFYVPFTVANAGAESATDVSIVFETRRGETLLEESIADVPFLPVAGHQEGELVTALDPATHEIVARVGTLLAP